MITAWNSLKARRWRGIAQMMSGIIVLAGLVTDHILLPPWLYVAILFYLVCEGVATFWEARPNPKAPANEVVKNG